ncbi:PucR family transcriptional regulator [Gordonia amicalis]|uniref:PucR family transcriptional regulator n=1 Tax=Gordonia TaxID=2053 RepID=UPI00177E7CBB|nr:MULTISPECIES: PucR family transcriptional regulator [Gordonia]MCR8899883.1 PucR family transcriptional regulator [Gordonia sp. GONU]UPW12172.1 PucR family transcriptional regulator [Gordonia amicalis]
MKPTIADILSLPVVRNGKPRQVGGGRLDREVRWAHVSDLADLTDLLQGGEIVLTTGPALLADPTGYLEGLAAAGAVGVIAELLDADVPDSVAANADRLELPVVVLERAIRFVDVTEEVHSAIVADQYEEVVFSRHVHEVFTGLGMRRAEVTEIVEAAAELIDSAVVLEDLTRQVLAFAGRGTPAKDLLRDWERRSRLTPTGRETSTSGPEGWLTAPVGAHRQEWGRLVVPHPGDLGERARMPLERAAQALALHRMIEQNWTELEMRAQNGLVDDLRLGRIPDEAEATARAHALGLQPGLTYAPLTIRVVESVSADQVMAQGRLTRALDSVRHSVRGVGRTALTALRPTGQMDLILSLPASRNTDVMTDVCTAIHTSLLRVDGVVRVTIGVAPDSTRLVDAARGLAESAHVAEAALSLPKSDKAFHRTTDVRLRGLIAVIRSDARVQAFAETELRGLLEHHARHDDNMLETLRRFIGLGGNKAELAKAMNLTRPTVYARLARIERILGVELDDAESRTSLHAALLILDSRPEAERGR